LPPGLSEILCEVEPYKPGAFSSELHAFVDDGGTREIVFTVHGTARGPTAK
jgi:hypothetical protein